MLMTGLVGSTFQMTTEFVKGMNLMVRCFAFCFDDVCLNFIICIIIQIINVSYYIVKGGKQLRNHHQVLIICKKSKYFSLTNTVYLAHLLYQNIIQTTTLKNTLMNHQHEQFQFRQSKHHDRNNNAKKQKVQKQQMRQTVNEDERKIILSINQHIGINLQQHLDKIQKFYQTKIIGQSISKAVIGTFQRKKLIQQGEFQLEKAYQDASYESKAYADKIQAWLGDSIANSPALIEFQKYKQKKINERAAKISSIMILISKIAEKVQNKKIQAIKRDFQNSFEQRLVKIPQNNQYNRALYKFKFIKQKTMARKKEIQTMNASQNFLN